MNASIALRFSPLLASSWDLCALPGQQLPFVSGVFLSIVVAEKFNQFYTPQDRSCFNLNYDQAEINGGYVESCDLNQPVLVPGHPF